MKKALLIPFLLLLLLAPSCKKDKEYIYEVDDVTAKPEKPSKPSVKTTTEFISIAYSDLYGKTIGNNELVNLSVCYNGFGDKKLVEEIIIKNFLKDPSVKMPTLSEMKADVNAFVIKTYKKFYAREPNAFERWNMSNIINSDPALTPELVYYAFMTSNEYRYY